MQIHTKMSLGGTGKHIRKKIMSDHAIWKVYQNIIGRYRKVHLHKINVGPSNTERLQKCHWGGTGMHLQKKNQCRTRQYGKILINGELNAWNGWKENCRINAIQNEQKLLYLSIKSDKWYIVQKGIQLTMKPINMLKYILCYFYESNIICLSQYLRSQFRYRH